MDRELFGKREASLTQEHLKTTRSFRDHYGLPNLAYFTRAFFQTGNFTERANL